MLHCSFLYSLRTVTIADIIIYYLHVSVIIVFWFTYLYVHNSYVVFIYLFSFFYLCFVENSFQLKTESNSLYVILIQSCLSS